MVPPGVLAASSSQNPDELPQITSTNTGDFAMFDPSALDDLTQRLAAFLPPGTRELQRDMERNLRAALSAAFARLDLVTREEFEVQKGVLERTRAQLIVLERQVAALEAQRPANNISPANPSNP